MLERLRLRLNISWFKALAGIALVSTVAYAAQNFNSINVNGNITVTGTVDGRDVSTDGSVIDAITTNGVTALTSAEVDQLENINATTISSATWGFLGGINQALSSTSSPTFNSITGTLSTAAQTNITSLGTLTALSVDAPLNLLQQTTPANPAASRNKLYFKSDDKLYRLTSAGVETEVGADSANRSLSNLTAPTAVNVDLIFDTGTYAIIQTKDSTGANSQNLFINTGFPDTGFNSGNLFITTSDADGSAISGNIFFGPGNTVSGAAGALTFDGGDSTNGAGSTINLTSGGSTNSTGGDINITAAAGVNANSSGSIVLDSTDHVRVVNSALRLFNAAGEPINTATAVAGDIYFNTTSNKIRVHNGTIWADVGSSGADVTLSNLTSPTAVSEDLIFDTGADAYLRTRDESGLDSRNLFIGSGGSDQASGKVTIYSGAAGTGGNTGGIDLTVTNASSTGNGGAINILGGDSVDGTGSDITIQTGSSTNGTGGGLLLKADDGDTQGGSVSIVSGGSASSFGGDINLLASAGVDNDSTGTIALNTSKRVTISSGLFQLWSNASNPTSPAPAAGDMYFNSGVAQPRYYDGSAWFTLASLTGTETFTNKTFDADGTGNSITNIENADIKAAAAIAYNKLAALTASRVLVSDGSGFVSVSSVPTTNLPKITAANITYSAGTPTVTNEYGGDWISSITDGGTGQPTLNVSGFTTAPACTCNGKESAVSGSACTITGTSTSTITIRMRDLAGTFQDEHLFIICTEWF